MSKAYGKKLWNDLDDLSKEDLVKGGARVKYLRKEKAVVVEMYSDYKFKVPWEIFQEMILFDKIHGRQKIYLSDDITNFYTEKVEVDYGSEYEKLVSLDTTFSSDSYEEVCLLQFKYRLEPGMLKEIKRKAHLRKLGRCDSAWVTLRERVCKGGRPAGYVVDKSEDSERRKYLVDNYDMIVKKILARDSYVNFYELEKEVHPSMRESDIREKYKVLKKEFYAI